MSYLKKQFTVNLKLSYAHILPVTKGIRKTKSTRIFNNRCKNRHYWKHEGLRET